MADTGDLYTEAEVAELLTVAVLKARARDREELVGLRAALRVAELGGLSAAVVRKALTKGFDPNEKRDEGGKWTGDGGGSPDIDGDDLGREDASGNATPGAEPMHPDDLEMIRADGFDSEKQFRAFEATVSSPTKADLEKPVINLWHGTSKRGAKGIIRDGEIDDGDRGTNATADMDHAKQYPEDTGAEVIIYLQAATDGLSVDPNDQIGETVKEGLFPDQFGSSCTIGPHRILAAFDVSEADDEALTLLAQGKVLEAMGRGVTVMYHADPTVHIQKGVERRTKQPVRRGKVASQLGADVYAPPEAELLDAAIALAEEGHATGEDVQGGLDSLYELIDDPDELERVAAGSTFEKAWDESKHPRGKNGHFISRDAIADAKRDPAKAAKLRAEVKPADKDKLEDALSGKTDLGTTAKRQNRDLTAEKRQKKQADRRTAMDLVYKIRDAHASGKVVAADDLHALIPHLSTLTGEELRDVRTQLFRLGATFNGERRVSERVKNLTDWARKQALDARMKEQGFGDEEAAAAKQVVGAAKPVAPETLVAPEPATPAESQRAAQLQPAPAPLAASKPARVPKAPAAPPAVGALAKKPLADKQHLAQLAAAAPDQTTRDYLENAAHNVPGDKGTIDPADRRHQTVERLAAEHRNALAAGHTGAAGHLAKVIGEYGGKLEGAAPGETTPFDGSLYDSAEKPGEGTLWTGQPARVLRQPILGPDGRVAVRGEMEPAGSAAPQPRTPRGTGRADDAAPTEDEIAAASRPHVPKPKKDAKPKPAAQVSPTSGFGQAGESHPLGQTRGEQLKNLNGAVGNYDDPLGHQARGVPPKLDLPAFENDLAGVIGRARDAGQMGADYSQLYPVLGKKYGLTKDEFARTMSHLDRSGRWQFSDWPASLDDIPDPALATTYNGTVNYTVTAGSKNPLADPNAGDQSLNIDHPAVREKYGPR